MNDMRFGKGIITLLICFWLGLSTTAWAAGAGSGDNERSSSPDYYQGPAAGANGPNRGDSGYGSGSATGFSADRRCNNVPGSYSGGTSYAPSYGQSGNSTPPGNGAYGQQQDQPPQFANPNRQEAPNYANQADGISPQPPTGYYGAPNGNASGYAPPQGGGYNPSTAAGYGATPGYGTPYGYGTPRIRRRSRIWARWPSRIRPKRSRIWARWPRIRPKRSRIWARWPRIWPKRSRIWARWPRIRPRRSRIWARWPRIRPRRSRIWARWSRRL